MARNLESSKVKAPQLVLLSVLATIGAVMWADMLEDALLDKSGFSYVFAVIGTLLLIGVIVAYKFESAYAELYTST